MSLISAVARDSGAQRTKRRGAASWLIVLFAVLTAVAWVFPLWMGAATAFRVGGLTNGVNYEVRLTPIYVVGGVASFGSPASVFATRNRLVTGWKSVAMWKSRLGNSVWLIVVVATTSMML